MIGKLVPVLGSLSNLRIWPKFFGSIFERQDISSPSDMSNMDRVAAEPFLKVFRDLVTTQQLALDQRKSEFEWTKSHAGLATKQDLDRMENRIMSAISDFLAKQKTFNDRQGTAVDEVVASISGLTDDVKALNDKITELQNSSGGVTPEDQATIDELQTSGEALATRLEAASTAIKALDAQTPPVVPPTP